MGLEIKYIEGQTPLAEEENEGLIVRAIETRKELDEAEQRNIGNAIEWSLRISSQLDEILSEEFIKRVHRKMFDDVWKWAGSYRTTNKNLGVDKFDIPVELRKVSDDCKYWIENKSFTADEIAVRFKHRVVIVHPFANGNGRHSRLIGDILVNKYFKQPVFSWGSKSMIKPNDTREKYLSALRKADNGNYEDLIVFAKS